VKVLLAIPVLNPGRHAAALAAAIMTQRRPPDEMLILDSESTDGSVAHFAAIGARVVRVPRAEFDHGATRNIALRASDADVTLFLTQDAIPADGEAFAALLDALARNPLAGAAFGRQLPHHDAGLAAIHARTFNYPPQSVTRTRDDLARLGVRATFCSNSFAAYRRSALANAGYFPERQIFGEDAALCARLLAAGWEVEYVAEARVHHSHDYSVREEVARYFDLGVFHATDRQYRALVGSAGGEGMRFVRGELAFFRAHRGVRTWPGLIARNGMRWLGYQLGRRQRLLPRPFRMKLGMNKGFWQQAGA
jgi:rhamnosyltransferase